MPDTIVEDASGRVATHTGRFLATPVARTNLHGDLVRFLTEVLVVEEQEGISLLAMSLTNNVLDAHLDATYWQGRKDGYHQHHGTTPGVSST